MKVIQTHYNGYKFRSRLEARWAVYFDALGIEYYYEHEGFDLGEAGCYLPDFYLPHARMWAEVKPVALTKDEIQKAEFLARATQQHVLMLVGPADRIAYDVCHYDNYSRPAGIDYYSVSLLPHYRKGRLSFYSCPTVQELKHPTLAHGVLAARSARFNEHRHPEVITA